jgi:hypothetical protein
MTRVLGVDPGLHGAYALVGDVKPVATPFPMAGRVVDLVETWRDWKALAPEYVLLERPQAMPKMSRHGSLHFGLGCGALEGLAIALAVEFGAHVEWVQPQTWKRAVLAGTARDKAAAIEWARRAYPSVPLVMAGCRLPHDGLADALAIATYGLRTFAGAAARSAA